MYICPMAVITLITGAYENPDPTGVKFKHSTCVINEVGSQMIFEANRKHLESGYCPYYDANSDIALRTRLDPTTNHIFVISHINQLVRDGYLPQEFNYSDFT